MEVDGAYRGLLEFLDILCFGFLVYFKEFFWEGWSCSGWFSFFVLNIWYIRGFLKLSLFRILEF